MAPHLLPSTLPFGKLEITETWVFYEGPRLFVARNRTGQAFLFNTIDEDEDSITYLVVAVSEDRLIIVKSGGLPLRTAFVAPEADVHRVRCDYRQEVVDVTQVAPEDLGDVELPTPSAVVSLPAATLPEFDPTSLAARANAEGRTFLAIRLNPANLRRTEYPARPLADALKVTQSLAEALVQEEAGEVTRRGPLPARIVEDAELSVLELQAASFVAVLATSSSTGADPERPQLGLEMPETTLALQRLQRLLLAVSDADALRSDIQQLGVRSVTKVRDLLELSLDQSTSVRTYLAVPGMDVVSAEITTGAASQGMLILSERDERSETVVLPNATLVGVNLRTWVFELTDESVEPGRFSGRVAEGAREQIKGLPTGEAYRYSAEVIAESSFSDLTDEVRIKYRLKSITRAGDSESM